MKTPKSRAFGGPYMGGPFRILKMKIIMRFIVQIILSLHTGLVDSWSKKKKSLFILPFYST